MKKLKKLTLNKEIVSMLGGNEMNHLKGGTGFSLDQIGGASCQNCPPDTVGDISCDTKCFICPDPTPQGTNGCTDSACGQTCLNNNCPYLISGIAYLC